MHSRIIVTKQLKNSKGSTSFLVNSYASFLNVLLKMAFVHLADSMFTVIKRRHIKSLKISSYLYA